MRSIRNEYEITIEPSGRWRIDHLIDDHSHVVAWGVAPRGDSDSAMEIAEKAARKWVNDKLREIEVQEDYRKQCKVFTMPATVRR